MNFFTEGTSRGLMYRGGLKERKRESIDLGFKGMAIGRGWENTSGQMVLKS